MLPAFLRQLSGGKIMKTLRLARVTLSGLSKDTALAVWTDCPEVGTQLGRAIGKQGADGWLETLNHHPGTAEAQKAIVLV